MGITKDITIRLIGNIKQFVKSMNITADKLKATGQSFSSFGRGAAIRFAALSAGIIGLTKTFAGLEKGITNTLTLLDAPQITQFGDTIKNQVTSAVADMGFAIEDANKAMFDTVSALGASNKAMETFAEAQRLAIGGVAELSVTTDGLTSVINAYGKETTKAKDVGVAFFTAQKFGKTTVAALSSNIGKAAPIAKQLGVSYEELLASMSQLTLGGLSTEEATTALRATMVALLKPAKGAEKALRKLGVPVGATEVKAAGFVNTLRALTKAAKENPDAVGEMIPNIRALIGAGALGSEELDNLEMIIASIGEETLKSADGLDVLTLAVEKQQATVDFAFKKMAGSFKIASAAIGEALAPALLNISELITNISNRISGLSPAQKKWIATTLLVVTGLLGLAAVIGLVGGALLQAAAAAASLEIALLPILGTVALVVAAIALLALGIKTNFLGLGTAFKNVMLGIKLITDLVIGAIDAVKFSMKSLEEKSISVKDALRNNVRGLKSTKNELSALKNKVLTVNDDLEAHENKIRSVTGELGRLLKEQKKLKKQTIEIEVKRLEQIPGVTPQDAERIAGGDVEKILADEEESPEVIRKKETNDQLENLQDEHNATELSTEAQHQKNMEKVEKAGQDKVDKFEKEQLKRRMVFLAANNQAELKQREQSLTDLAALTQSKNQTLAAIGKAAAIHQVIISTQAAMARAIEFLGPFGIPAAIALAAFGAERISTINSAGLALGSADLDEDMIAQFSKNEIVVPETFAEGIRGGELALVGAGSDAGGGGGTQITNNFDFGGAVLGSPSEDFITEIEDSIFERAKLDIGGID